MMFKTCAAASCYLLLAVIVFNGVFASAHRSSAASVQQGYKDRPGGGFDDRATSGPYEGHKDEQYHSQESQYVEQHPSEGPHAAGKHIVSICLQRTSSTFNWETGVSE